MTSQSSKLLLASKRCYVSVFLSKVLTTCRFNDLFCHLAKLYNDGNLKLLQQLSQELFINHQGCLKDAIWFKVDDGEVSLQNRYNYETNLFSFNAHCSLNVWYFTDSRMDSC